MNISQWQCFRHVKFQPDSSELRRFAAAMLIGFSVLGLFAIWHAKGLSTRALVLFAVGLTLAVCAFIPKLNRVAYLIVYIPTSLIGYVISHIIMVAMFFLVFVPLGGILRLIGKDLLRLKPRGPRALWLPLDRDRGVDSYYRQF